MNDQTKKALMESGFVTSKQVAEAEAAAGDAAAFDRHLMTAASLDEAQLFNAISNLYKLPYISLEGLKIPADAELVCSELCIKRWKLFPVDFDIKEGLMSIAVGSPAHAERIERYFRFLMEPYDLGFVLTDESSLQAAVAHVCKERMSTGVQQKPSPVTAGGKRKIIIPLPKQKSADNNDPAAKRETSTGSRAADQSSSETVESVPDALAKSLTSAISLLVSAHIGGDPAALSSAKERVRYCQLTAARLEVKPIEATKVILAGWLSSLADRSDVIRQFVCPFDLEAILFAEESDRPAGIEALILSLVKVYQEFQQQAPENARDVGLARRGLFMRWPAASDHQDILETFLQVLMDEQFVEKLGKHSGRVGIFASSGASLPGLEAFFERSGYSVKTVSLFQDLESLIQGNGADLLIVCASRNDKDPMSDIRRIKSLPALSSIPLMAAIGEGAGIRGAEFLRAGADDFIAEPMDIELLLLKADKLANISGRRDGGAGVSGSLADMSFSDLVQVLSAGCKSMDVSVTHMDQSGRIVLREGNVVHAEADGITGEQAFYVLMQWNTGQFSMSECQHFPEPTVTASTMSLLMEGSRIVDERSAQL